MVGCDIDADLVEGRLGVQALGPGSLDVISRRLFADV